MKPEGHDVTHIDAYVGSTSSEDNGRMWFVYNMEFVGFEALDKDELIEKCKGEVVGLAHISEYKLSRVLHCMLEHYDGFRGISLNVWSRKWRVPLCGAVPEMRTKRANGKEAKA